MPNINNRITRLEQFLNPRESGQVVFCNLAFDEPSAEEAERRIAEAKAKAGPHGTVVLFVEDGYTPPGEPSKTIRMDWGPDELHIGGIGYDDI